MLCAYGASKSVPVPWTWRVLRLALSSRSNIVIETKLHNNHPNVPPIIKKMTFMIFLDPCHGLSGLMMVQFSPEQPHPRCPALSSILEQNKKRNLFPTLFPEKLFHVEDENLYSPLRFATRAFVMNLARSSLSKVLASATSITQNLLHFRGSSGTSWNFLTYARNFISLSTRAPPGGHKKSYHK